MQCLVWYINGEDKTVAVSTCRKLFYDIKRRVVEPAISDKNWIEKVVVKKIVVQKTVNLLLFRENIKDPYLDIWLRTISTLCYLLIYRQYSMYNIKTYVFFTKL